MSVAELSDRKSGHPTSDPALAEWVHQIAQLTQPDEIQWCDGSAEEIARLTRQLVDERKLTPLNPALRPNSFLARSDPSDVARVEDRTFICSQYPDDAGPTNNWRDPVEMRSTLTAAFAGCMRGRTMYVMPFSMGPLGGPISQCGVQVTDSGYVVVSMRIMTRMGVDALQLIESGKPWVRAVHSVGVPLIDKHGVRHDDSSWPCNSIKYISHFPETREIFSFGSGYGGNALLAKKSFALRIASVMGHDDGWLAEHMLIIKITSPEGRSYHIAAAFPSACGKTNLAMLQPTLPGWRVETIGDDIAWLRPGADGRLRAINPEAGFFGVAPGTGEKTNPVAVKMLWGNTIFTNVALTEDGDVWWEGLTEDPPSALTDWRGNTWTPEMGESGTPAAHPNSRFTVATSQCPTIATSWETHDGVPIDAILFGGRRATNVPLVVEARDWRHGVFMGATISSEKTAAQEGKVGELRRDPFAMLPFCGYNMADYWGHWLDVGEQLGENCPKIFHVNWFRKSDDGRFLWPGFGENARVLEWITRRLDNNASVRSTPIGGVPKVSELRIGGLNLSQSDVDELFAVDAVSWLAESDLTEEFFTQFGERLPSGLFTELESLRARLNLTIENLRHPPSSTGGPNK